VQIGGVKMFFKHHKQRCKEENTRRETKVQGRKHKKRRKRTDILFQFFEEKTLDPL
jgi:hypothetical protein